MLGQREQGKRPLGVRVIGFVLRLDRRGIRGNRQTRAVEQTPARVVRRLPLHINDPAFADALARAFQELWHAAAPR